MARAMVTMVFAWLLLPTMALAAGGGGHGGGPPVAGQWLLLLFTIVNFSILVYLITRFARNPLRDFLTTRRKELVEAMAEAARAKAEADQLKAEYEEKAAGLERAKSELIEEIRTIAEADRERVLSTAREAGERLKRDAERTAKSDLERARHELRAEAANLAAEMAGAQTRERLSEEGKKRLLREFIEKVASQ